MVTCFTHKRFATWNKILRKRLADIDMLLATERSLNLVNILIKVSKGAKIRNRYNQVPHLTQDTNGTVTKLTVIHYKREPERSALSQQVTTRHT